VKARILRQVPYVDLAAQHRPLREEILHAIGEVLDSGIFVLGSKVEQFEREFAKLCGTRFAVGVASGLDALVLSLRGLGIGPGDEVITAPNSFVASGSAIALAGARPVFADVTDDYSLEPQAVERAITQRTRAIVPVHLTGRPARMPELGEIAQRHGLLVIEDAAQAVGARLGGRSVGSFGDAGAFSLHPLKTLGACGDGGVVTTDSQELYRRLKLLRNHGLRSRDDCAQWAPNSRLDTLQAAILLVKLDYLEEWTEIRRANARRYIEGLADLSEIVVPRERPDERAVYHTFVVLAERREELREHLTERGIGTQVHYPTPIHLLMAARELGYRRGDFPVAERQSEQILSLPVHHALQAADIDYVCEAIREFYRGAAA
jgi:dTDP-4-amino-4,6-dideoxygalactose transaminase